MTHYLKLNANLTLLVVLLNPVLVFGITICEMDPARRTCTFTRVITNVTHPYFHPSFPDPIKIEEVSVENSKYLVLTDEICKMFPNLKNLQLKQCFLKYINDGALNNCLNLISLDISNNDVTEVNRDLFKSNSKLEGISFSSNKISYVDTKMFTYTKNLISLDLDDNFLVHFDFQCLPILEKVAVFNINTNNLLNLDEKSLFEKFPMLTALGIDDNLLECRSLEILMKVIQEKEVEQLIDFGQRNRIPSYKTNLFEDVECLDDEEHSKAIKDNLGMVQKARQDSCPLLNGSDDESDPISLTLILLGILRLLV